MACEIRQALGLINLFPGKARSNSLRSRSVVVGADRRFSEIHYRQPKWGVVGARLLVVVCARLWSGPGGLLARSAREGRARGFRWGRRLFFPTRLLMTRATRPVFRNRLARERRSGLSALHTGALHFPAVEMVAATVVWFSGKAMCFLVPPWTWVAQGLCEPAVGAKRERKASARAASRLLGHRPQGTTHFSSCRGRSSGCLAGAENIPAAAWRPLIDLTRKPRPQGSPLPPLVIAALAACPARASGLGGRGWYFAPACS